ncbi:aminotransferase class I/II-fold pyridoxal phosphate-dependent enzyme, partial [Actinotignum timonense]|nr:aminotransferase class I/II-fold pyridoxal phosphate-dependent enzyme [Actinotignum timonense]
RIVSELASIDGIEVAPPDGAFYVFADVAGLLGGTGPRRATSSLELADQLLSDINVAAVPGEAFGVGGFLRFSYALSDAELAEGMARLRDYFA